MEKKEYEAMVKKFEDTVLELVKAYFRDPLTASPEAYPIVCDDLNRNLAMCFLAGVTDGSHSSNFKEDMLTKLSKDLFKACEEVRTLVEMSNQGGGNE
jgi:hypothetical protein